MHEISDRENNKPAIEIAPLMRRAAPRDATQIFELYQRLYGGKYTDPILADIGRLRATLREPDYFWMIADVQGSVVGSVIYRFDRASCLAKVYGAVVDPDYRGHNLAENLMTVGYQKLREEFPPVEVVYATTRTVSPAPQRMTAKLGYKKLGIFPNVHKTEGYETHCLTALFADQALDRRFTDFTLHPHVAPLFAIAAKECGLPPLLTASPESYASAPLKPSVDVQLEAIEAVKFVEHCFNREKANQSHHWFFPFHEPNMLFTNADQTIQVFCYLSAKDRHCVVIGIQDLRGAGYNAILDKVTQLLRELGTRYIEFIVPADETLKIEEAVKAEFIPSGYFPAMHGRGRVRYDFVVFSRSFETLNFRHIALDPVNKSYLKEYFKIWSAQSAPDIDQTP